MASGAAGPSGGTQVASLYASLGLQFNHAQWSQGTAMLTATQGLAGKQLRQAQSDNALIVRTRNATLRSQVSAQQAAQAQMSKASSHATSENMGLLSSLKGVTGGVIAATAAVASYVAALGLGKAYDHLIGFNEEIQNAKISLSAMLQGNMGGSWETAKNNAEGLYQEFQKFSTTTPVTTQEILEFGRGVAVATFQAGGKIKDLTTITEMGTVAAKTLGVNSQYAALELTMMLEGTVSHRMRFVQQLLGMAHVSMEQFRAMNAKQRLSTVTGVLTSESMRRANSEMATSFTGVTSTLKDKLQIALGKVGLPLFQAITQSVGEINGWLERNAVTIERIGAAVGGALASGFAVVKDLALQVYGLFERNHDVIMRLLGIVGVNLVSALKMMVDWFGAGMKAAEGVLQFLNTGYGQFLTMLVATPGILLQISELVGGLGDLFDALAQSSAIRVLIYLAEKLDDLFGNGGAEGGGGDMDELERARAEYVARKSGQNFWDRVDNRPTLALPRSALAGGAGGDASLRPSVSVSVGDIHVHAPNADGEEVAQRTKRVLDQHLNDLFRQTHDQLNGAR